MRYGKTSYRPLLGAMVVTGLFTGAFTGTAGADTIFLSTQLRPIEEATKVRNEILSGVSSPVEYVVEEPPQFAVRMEAERQTGKGTISLVGALHGELAPLVPKGTLKPLDDLAAKLSGRGFPDDLMKFGKLGTEHQQYIPWMQATYVMVANKDALPLLPEGASVDTLTYTQLIEWGKRIEAETGTRKIGFPAGPKGLMPRFFQGYFYPSFTSGVVRPFKSADAVAGWRSLKELWAVTTPNSTSFDFMQEPLLSDEVWVAWDHLARVKEAISLQPDQFVVFPAPAGPKGRGYMPVVAGLAIPAGAPDTAGAEATIEHLTMPETQIVTAQEVGFFPVVNATLPDDLDPAVEALSKAVATMQNAPDALVSLLPIGLGDKGGEFNKIYMDSFQRIVLRGEPIETVLGEEAGKLQALMTETGAACWAPDAESKGPCPVE
jgi:multiple sugar transport system substrate-binding protein